MRTALVIFLAASPLFADAPSFECSDGNATQYSLSLSPTTRYLAVRIGGVSREYLLSEPNLGVAAPEGAPLYYVGQLPQGKTPYTTLQMGTMVRTQFRRDLGKTFQSVDIILDHTPINRLLCRTPVTNPAVVLESARMMAARRLLEPLRLWGGKIEGSGKLSPVSLLATEATLLQFHHSEKTADPKLMQEFAELAGEDIRKIPPKSLDALRGRLGLTEKEFLERVLDACHYREYSDVQRIAGWVTEGLTRKTATGLASPDWEQARSGLAAFFESKAYEVPDQKALFAAEIAKAIPALSPFDLLRLTMNQKDDRERFLLKVWGGGQTETYRKLKPAFVPLSAMEHDLRPLQERTHFAEFAKHFSQLTRVAAFNEPAVRGTLRKRILPLVDRLSAAERKSLFDLMPAPERKAFDSLRDPDRSLSSK